MKRTLLLLIVFTLGSLVAHAQVPLPTLIRITKAEDERRWDAELRDLLSHSDAAIRKRAALATGRIGNEDSVASLTALMREDADVEVRAMAAFALGEVESVAASDALLEVLKKESGELRARALEALGKIAAALPADQQPRQRELGAAIRDALELETGRSGNELTVLLGLTAALRARPPDAGPTIAKFLNSPNPRIRADAANALARLRLNSGNEQLRKLLTSDPDPNVRANAARVLGVTEDKPSFDALLSRTLSDNDLRVRVSAIRALAQIRDSRAAAPLIKQQTSDLNELLEIATTLGRLLAQTEDQAAIEWLRKANSTFFFHRAPEIEQALVRIAPALYLSELGATTAVAEREVQKTMRVDWRAAAAIATGLGEVAALPDSVKNKAALSTAAETLLRAMLDYRQSNDKGTPRKTTHSEYAVSNVLRAFAAFKPKDLRPVLIAHLLEPDVVVRDTTLDLLGELPPAEETTRALIAAWPRATQDSQNDAALSLLAALAHQKTTTANEAIKAGLDSRNHLVRRRAAALLKTNGAGDFSSRIGTVQTQNTTADYRRALSRIGRKVRAVVTTSKGSFTIELLPAEAPLTVDNFVKLAQRNYFRGIMVHRVVPNFVIQDGDPRGDGTGGPDYQIRCEINQEPYDRATVGMALAGKDTGGSQWFVTHAPQPHLDGGYTVFGRVIAGMDVVDRIARGDIIRSISIR